MMLHRRQLLHGAGGALAVLGLPLSGCTTRSSQHVMYPGTNTREEAWDHLDRLRGRLGDKVAARLRIALVDDKAVVVYDRSDETDGSSVDAAEAVAREHDAVLKKAFGEKRPMAIRVPEAELEPVYNIRYGGLGDLEGRKADYTAVALLLGGGVSKGLVVEKTDNTHHQLVYKRLGDRKKTEEVARAHAELLAEAGITARATPERYHDVVWDGRSQKVGSTSKPFRRDSEAPSSPATTGLRDVINELIQTRRRSGELEPTERTAWWVYDLEADRPLAAINTDTRMEAATLVKPLVAMAYLYEVSRQRITYDGRAARTLERMMRDAPGQAAAEVLEALGGTRKTVALLQNTHPELTGGLALDALELRADRTYGNTARAQDLGRFLRDLWFEDVPRAAELKRLMNIPGPDRLYRGVSSIPSGTTLYGASGSSARVAADMGILEARRTDGRRFAYAMVAMIDQPEPTRSYTRWIRRRSALIRDVSATTYDWLKAREGLV